MLKYWDDPSKSSFQFDLKPMSNILGHNFPSPVKVKHDLPPAKKKLFQNCLGLGNNYRNECVVVMKFSQDGG